MGFANEKDHPEVAPSQFEMNYSYTEALIAADQVQLYKLLCRQIAQSLDMSACFRPPVTGVNGNGMHTNLSLTRGGKNLFFDPKGKDGLSPLGWQCVERILAAAPDICLILNASVNAYRRLDPHYEAPNQIKASAIDRGAMVRIPLGNERSARIEVRSIAPDANPYMAIYTLLRTGLEGPAGSSEASDDGKRSRTRFLPDNIYDALRLFKASRFVGEVLGESIQDRFADVKQASAERCPKALGHHDQDRRDPVPPRGHQPVPVEPVLGSVVVAARRPARGAHLQRVVAAAPTAAAPALAVRVRATAAAATAAAAPHLAVRVRAAAATATAAAAPIATAVRVRAAAPALPRRTAPGIAVRVRACSSCTSRGAAPIAVTVRVRAAAPLHFPEEQRP